MPQLIHSEIFWLAVTVLSGYIANSIVSRKLVANLPATSPAKRAIRALHGFLDKIDPPAMLVLLACSTLLLPLCSGCGGKVNAPTVTDAATLARNLADDALAAAIDASDKDGAAKFVEPVEKLKTARVAIETAQDVCGQVATIEGALTIVDCPNCTRAINVLREVCR
jgi:hypothetical protein